VLDKIKPSMWLSVVEASRRAESKELIALSLTQFEKSAANTELSVTTEIGEEGAILRGRKVRKARK